MLHVQERYRKYALLHTLKHHHDSDVSHHSYKLYKSIKPCTIMHVAKRVILAIRLSSVMLSGPRALCDASSFTPCKGDGEITCSHEENLETVWTMYLVP